MCQMANVLDYTGIAEMSFQGEDAERLFRLHAALRVADGTWRAARRTGVADDLLRDLVQDYIDASYAFQKVAYGRVKVRMSVSVLLRLS